MTTDLFPPEAAERLRDYLAAHHLPTGVGTVEEGACSVAAINLALTGELTDQVPDCMSLVIGRWVRRIQDAIPDTMRNGEQWKMLLPVAAGTGRDPDDERRRLSLVMEWLWETVLPSVQPVADRYGYGEEWRRMTTAKTVAAAAAKTVAAAADAAAARAADDADAYAAAAYAAAAYAADATRAAADAAADAYAAAYAAYVTVDAAYVAAYAGAYAAAYAAADAAAYAAADAAADAAAWERFDPPGLLERLITA
jgi:hypothetical protein